MKLYGMMMLNEKSQAVIPADARAALGIGPGSKLLVMGSPDGNALMLVTTEQAEKMLQKFTDMSQAIRRAKTGGEPND